MSTDINLAIHAFVECLKKARACMVRRIKVGGTRKSAEWFDQDCFIHRKQCRVKLRRYRQTRCAEDRENYVKSRCAYRKLLIEKQTNNLLKEKKAQSLADSIEDPKQFWKEVKACIGFGRKQNVENKITKDQWLEHFMTVFNSGNNDRESDAEKWEKSSEHHSPNIESLDCPVSEEEVTEPIRKLTQGKASGLDNV